MDLILALLVLTIIKATPIVYAALGGVISERSGVVNIALEGMMVAGGFFAVLISFLTHNPWIGLAGGIAAGALVGWLFGIAVTRFKVDQIVAGTGVNLICTGGAAYALLLIWNQPGASVQVAALGNAFWILIVAAFVLAGAMHWFLYRTPWGLRVVATGENPHATKSAGIDPLRVRVWAVLASGALAGLGGAFLSVGEVNLFSDGMTAGRGFIALAAVIFGRWTPLGSTGAALVFGLFEALEFVVQGHFSWLPPDAMQALPYLVALLALLAPMSKYRAPAADGIPY